MNIQGRPFLHGRLECDDPKLYDNVSFLLDPAAAFSFVTTKAIPNTTLPQEILGAKFRTNVPLPWGTTEEYEFTFRRLRVVQYSENNPVASTFGRDFLSLCPMATINGQTIVQTKAYKLTIG